MGRERYNPPRPPGMSHAPSNSPFTINWSVKVNQTDAHLPERLERWRKWSFCGSRLHFHFVTELKRHQSDPDHWSENSWWFYPQVPPVRRIYPATLGSLQSTSRNDEWSGTLKPCDQGAGRGALLQRKGGQLRPVCARTAAALRSPALWRSASSLWALRTRRSRHKRCVAYRKP